MVSASLRKSGKVADRVGPAHSAGWVQSQVRSRPPGEATSLVQARTPNFVPLFGVLVTTGRLSVRLLLLV